MLLDPGEKLVPEEYVNLPCCLNLFNNLKIIIALNNDKPDFNLIKGNINKNIGAAKKTLPAIINIIPISIEKVIIINLIDLETFLVLASENQVKISAKIIKIIIPKKIKFIY